MSFFFEKSIKSNWFSTTISSNKASENVGIITREPVNTPSSIFKGNFRRIRSKIGTTPIKSTGFVSNSCLGKASFRIKSVRMTMRKFSFRLLYSN